MPMPTHIVAVGGIVENEKGEILLVKSFYRGWEFPGGQVEVGENLMDALCREIREESGIEVEVYNLIGVYTNSGTYKWFDGITDIPTKVMMDFRCKAIGGRLSTSDETSDSCFVPRNQVLDMISVPAYQIRYQTYLDGDGSIRYMEYVSKPNFSIKLDREI